LPQAGDEPPAPEAREERQGFGRSTNSRVSIAIGPSATLSDHRSYVSSDKEVSEPPTSRLMRRTTHEQVEIAASADVRLSLVSVLEEDCTTLVNVVKEGNTYKKSGASIYDGAYAIWEADSVCVSAGQTDKHVRVGLTTDFDDAASGSNRYRSGIMMGLFPKSRLKGPDRREVRNGVFLPQWRYDEIYTSDTLLCIKVQGDDMVATADGMELDRRTTTTATKFAMLWFYEPEAAMTIEQVGGIAGVCHGEVAEKKAEVVPKAAVKATTTTTTTTTTIATQSRVALEDTTTTTTPEPEESAAIIHSPVFATVVIAVMAHACAQ